MPAPKKIEDISEKIRHEYTLTNNRINWLITSQTIFFGIYAIVYSNQEAINRREFNKVFEAIPWVGIASCSVIYISILAAIGATRIMLKEAKNYSSVGPKVTYYMGLVADIFLPIIFISTWIYILTTNFGWPIMFSLLAISFNALFLYLTEYDDKITN